MKCCEELAQVETALSDVQMLHAAVGILLCFLHLCSCLLALLDVAIFLGFFSWQLFRIKANFFFPYVQIQVQVEVRNSFMRLIAGGIIVYSVTLFVDLARQQS